MPTEGEIFIQLIQAFNGMVGLVIAVWIIKEGMKRMDQLQEQSSSFVKDVLKQQQDNNDQLMSLVSTLCAQPVPRITSQASKSVPNG